MTKKTQNIVNEMCNRMDKHAYWYSKGIMKFGELQKSLRREVKMFDNLRTGMFFYDLMSEKDFNETILIAEHKMDDIIDNILNI